MRDDIASLERRHNAPQAQLLREYQLFWQQRGFTYPSFLRWRCSDSPTWWSLRHGAPSGPHPILLDGPLKEMKIWPESGHSMINPEWADSWAEHFYSCDDALEWVGKRFSFREAMQMKRIGYRSPERAAVMGDIIKGRGWIPVLESRPDIKVPLHRNLRDLYSNASDIAAAVTALVLIPEFRFTQGQVNAIRDQYVDPANDFSTGYTVNRCVDVANVCRRMMESGWEIPDGDGVFSFIIGVIRWSHRGNRMINSAISQAEGDRDRFILLMKEAIQLSGGEPGDFSHWSLTKLTYSLNTGVPIDWVDDSLLDSIMAGDVPESGWVVDSESDKRTVVHFYNEDDLFKRIDDEANRIAVA